MNAPLKPKFSVYSTKNNPPMHFSGANGFPVGCYEPLLTALSQRYSISSLWHRGLWPSSKTVDSEATWDVYANDLIAHLKKQSSGPVIGVGHSMGATVTMIAAAKEPKLFSKLVLIEPVIISRFHSLLFRHAPTGWLNKQDPIKSALKTRQAWNSEDNAYQYFRKLDAYKRIPDLQLKTVVSSITDTNNGKTVLVYSKDWEIHNYKAARFVLNDYQKLKTPTVVIRGRPSLFVHDKTWQSMMRSKPNNVYQNELDYGHLMPLEAPSLTRQLIISGLNKLKKSD